MQILYDDHFCPSNDVVFSIVFSEKQLFVRLCSAVHGEEITLDGEPLSQATTRPKNVLLRRIRFDVLGVADNGQMFTIDMQRRYTKGRLERRAAFYMCQAVASQHVKDMRYEDLKPVHIAFVLSEEPKNDLKMSQRRVGLCYLDTGEPYDDLIELVLVYVPAVIRETPDGGDDDLYVFSRFFAIDGKEAAAAYAAEFGTNELSKELIRVYNMAVQDTQYLDELENDSYYAQRLTEAQLAEVVAETWDKAVAETEAKARADERVKTWEESKKEFTTTLEILKEKGHDLETAIRVMKGEIASN